MLKYTVILAAMFFVGIFCSQKENPVQYQPIGTTITGTVFYADSTAASYCNIDFDGTDNFSLEADSNGVFTIFPVRPGTYTFRAYRYRYPKIFQRVFDTTFVIDDSDSVISLDSIFLHERKSDYSWIWFSNLVVCDSLNKVQADIAYGSKERYKSKPFAIDVHRIKLVGSIDYQIFPYQTQITVIRNDEIVFDDIAYKGRLETPLFSIDNHDTISIKADDFTILTFETIDSSIIRDSIARVTQRVPRNHLHITTGEAELRRYGFGRGREKKQYCIREGDTLELYSYETKEAIDWDLLLVNTQTGDTCSHAIDKGCTQNEIFHSEGGIASSSDIINYEGDRIRGNDISDGDYSLFVSCYDGRKDSLPSKPTIHIEAGMFMLDSLSDPPKTYTNLFTYIPEKPLHKGDFHFVGTIRFPECTFVPGN